MEQRQKAEDLFLYTEKTQQQIAVEIGIDPKTLYRWIKQGHWQQLKSATRRMPSILVENIYEQLDDINYSISQRQRGERHPTKDESLTINRLTNCIGKVKKQTSQGQNIEFLMNFINWMQTKNNDLAKALTDYGSAYLNGTEVHGFHPYDIEYGEQTGSHSTSLSFGEGRGEVPLAQEHNPNQLELPFPEENMHNTSLSLGDTDSYWEAEASIGHESGIQNPAENPTQPPVNQQQVPQTEEPKMPETNFPGNRASETPPLKGDVPETTNVVSEQGDVGTMSDAPTPNETPNEDPPDFSDPNLLVKEYMRQKGLPIEEETQLYSIGGKIFTLRVDNKKKKP